MHRALTFALLALAAVFGACANTEARTETREEHWPNGQLEKQVTVKQDAEGNYVRHGRWTAWRENGQKMGESEYRDGKMHGRWATWRENGQKVEEIEYRDGVLVR